MTRTIPLPAPVAAIYRAVRELEALYPGRKFTPDGHLVGSIGEVVAAEALGLTLYPMSQEGHDAYDANGEVQIKMTGRKSVAMTACCSRLVVLRVVSPEAAEIVYDGCGQAAWENAGRMQKNGQRPISLSRLRTIAAEREATRDRRDAEHLPSRMERSEAGLAWASRMNRSPGFSGPARLGCGAAVAVTSADIGREDERAPDA